jgi:hypothetical protein
MAYILLNLEQKHHYINFYVILHCHSLSEFHHFNDVIQLFPIQALIIQQIFLPAATGQNLDDINLYFR